MQLKTVHNNCYSQNWREATNFCVEIMNSKEAQVKGKLGHVVHVCRLPYLSNVILSLSNACARIRGAKDDGRRVPLRA